MDWESELSVTQQCELLGLSRSSVYYKPVGESEFNLRLMEKIDKLYLKHPYYGSRRIAAVLSDELGTSINRKRVQRLMRKMGIEAIYPKPRLSLRDEEHEIYPYLLNGFEINRPNQVWSTDITYVPLKRGFLYLVAVIDWFSRYILSWELSNNLDRWFCIEALEKALLKGRPDIFNTDQGCQFTSRDFTAKLKAAQVRISMDGKGRALDNVFIERLWRTVKYEEVYLKSYEDVREAHKSLAKYLTYYNVERPHQALAYKTPEYVHHRSATNK